MVILAGLAIHVSQSRNAEPSRLIVENPTTQ